MCHILPAQTYYPLQQTQPVIWGNGFGINSLTRFPASAQALIPSDVWTNSQRSSGLQVRFRSNATSVTVNYTLSAKYSNNSWFSDMGANGLDLYVHKPDDKWYWCYPTNRTIGSFFTYSQLAPNDVTYNAEGYEYCLYMPPFTTVTSLSITVNNGAIFNFIPVTHDKKPIVVYGTSIVHGAVCSRSGNTWTNIVSRRISDRPMVNLGFSGVGRMEDEVIQVINQIDAEIFVLDCIPNMDNSTLSTEIEPRFTNAVDTLRKYHPQSAILLTEHAGYSDMDMCLSRKISVLDANSRLKSVYDNLIGKGYKNIYYLSKEEIDLDLSCDLGDYVHPNDKGMYKYADAYTSKLRDILNNNKTSLQTEKNGEIKISSDSDNSLTVLYPEGFSQKQVLDIYNIEGKKLVRKKPVLGSKEIFIQKMNKGFYVLVISDGQKSITKSFIIK